ncbi:MAG: Cell morphogenesis protein PAG1 [Piccolia ochrophora]|nr:MAG: Cell morphogenesis protein PAG1 [Piccolia ochrophora]
MALLQSGLQPSPGRQIGRPDLPPLFNAADSASRHNGFPPSNPTSTVTYGPPRTHSRESSLTRGAPSNSSARQASQGAPGSVVKGGVTPDLGLERGPSVSYGHHRQTSIVHGMQHSRNASFVNSPTSSPMSPHVVVTPGAGLGIGSDLGPGMAQGDGVEPTSNPSLLNTNGIGGGPSGYATPVTTPGSDRTLVDPNGSVTSHRRLEHMHSGKARRDHGHVHSLSRHHHQPELKTVGEFALHHLFNSVSTLVSAQAIASLTQIQFVGQADQKINQCIANPSAPEPHVEDICGPGVDLSFDQLIAALGHIARQKPKPLIDTLMFWRKAKSEAATNARMEATGQLGQHKGLPTMNGQPSRRPTEPLHGMSDSIGSTTIPNSATSPTALSPQDAVTQAERRSSVSIYLLCRVLIEVIGQSSLACVTPDMADRLEDIIFGQLKTAEMEQLSTSPLKMAHWRVFGQLLGVMSEIHFQSVADRFFKEMEKLQNDVLRGGLNRELVEGKLELVILGMSHIHVKSHPEENWEQSCEFMLSLGKLFANSHGQRIKHAYCQILEKLLMPIAATAGSELSCPKWRAVIDAISPKISQMLTKPRHWIDAFPLMAVLLCVSPYEIFLQQWQQTVSPLQAKLKDRLTRPVAFQAIARIIWTFLYRATEAPSVTVKKLEEVIRLIHPTGKRSHLSMDPAVSEPLIQVIRIIGFRHQDLCFRHLIFPMINSELFAAGKELRVEQLEPEKMVIGIRAFLAIMSDLEKGEEGRPPFPETFGRSAVTDGAPTASSVGSNGMSPSTSGIVIREERLSRPVVTSDFNKAAREHYARFCQILGNITIICDNTFGGQAALDEKFGAQTPKTPIADTFSFSRRDDYQGAADQKQGFYDLLHVAVQALPRCLSIDIPFNSIVNLLCTGTAHVQSNIAASSAQSLRSIARQSHAQPVTIGFARFIFNFDDRYSTMSDGGMLGPGHIENTLKLYVELLQIWIDEIRLKSKGAAAELSGGFNGTRSAQLDLSAILAHVEEVESHGLFFLCSQSRRVRSFAVTVLQLVTEFDTALGKENTRIIRIMEDDSSAILSFNDQNLTVAERSRLQRGMRKNNPQNTLIELCGSEVSYDATLWYKIFPNLVRFIFERCPFATTLSREIICARLLLMHKTISILSDPPKGSQNGSMDIVTSRSTGRPSPTSPEVMIEQWKLYLIFACTTLTNTGNQTTSSLQDTQHVRKVSKSPHQGQEKIGTARSLFQFVIPLLAVGSNTIRDAVVIALGSINVNSYRTLLESLQSVVALCNDEGRTRIHQRTASSPRRSRRTDRLRTEVTHVYKLTSHFLRDEAVASDDGILQNLITYTNDLKIFLSDAEVQNNWEFQKLRRHYCGLMEELFEGINRTTDPARWMPFEARKSSFALMEDWCGYSPNQNQIRQREEEMRQIMVDSQRDVAERGVGTAAMEIEKRDLRTAALSAMATLCGGPLSITTERKANLHFDVRRMLTWIHSIFENSSDKMHVIGRRALKNLIVHNKEHAYLMERSIRMCYLAEAPKALESYFEVASQVLLENKDYPLAFWKILGAGLFILGNEKSELRSKAAQLLRTLEERQQRNSKIQDYEIGIADKTTAVYKLAQFEISRRLATQHSDLAFHIFSESTFYFKNLGPSQQRNMVAAILPWIQNVELQLDPNGGPTAPSYMVLANLFEITISCSTVLHNEVQALWQALATGPHGGNVQLVLDFIMSLCLERREQNFVDFAKQIVVFLSSTPAGLKVVEFLLLQITPRAMVQEKREPLAPPSDATSLPYLADLSHALPGGNKQSGFSLGQLSLILLVDLMVSPVQLAAENVPLLLQIVFVLWDHYIPLVQEQAREMLVHLIHELVISKLEDDTTVPSKKAIEELVDAIRRHEPYVVWAYDTNGAQREDVNLRVPRSMENLASEVVNVFALAYPAIREQWGKITLVWATSCPVRHVACRSFQVFRCILISLDQSMLADMLARLSNTIADDESDYQTFSMEILATLRTIIGALDPQDLLQYPQLFWTTCACLNTIHEREFMESLEMLEKFIDKVDLGSPEVVQLLSDNMPQKWEGTFEGVQPLIYQGLRSAASLDRTMALLEKLALLPNNALLGDSSRILFTILALVPQLLNEREEDTNNSEALARAEKLAQVAEIQGWDLMSKALTGFVNLRYRTSTEFLARMVSAIRGSFFPDFEFQTLVFLMGLLTNRHGWFKIRIMQLLCLVIPEIDMRKPEITSHGPDLISPLLRLLQTQYCSNALEVLDHIMTMPGTPMDKHHIRMSMAGSHSRAIRKEYERTQSLFGIPEETGWSIPMPAIHSTTTRTNVHAVFYTCANPDSMAAGTAATPDLEFHEDDYHYGFPFPGHDRTATMASEEGRMEGNMGDLVMKLDSLDDFFDDNLISSPSSDVKSPGSVGFPADTTDAGARYEQQTLPLLRKSLKRTASITSLQNGFTDAKLPVAGAAGVTSPVPATTTVPKIPAASARPGMHPRVMTTPAPPTLQSAAMAESMSDEDMDEIFSDDEYKTNVPFHVHEGSSTSLGSRIRSGTRSGMRRLTGSSSTKDRERQRELIWGDRRMPLPPKSPKVPKIPSNYLQNAHSPST